MLVALFTISYEMDEMEPPKKHPRWDKFDSQRIVSYIGDGKINPAQTNKEYIRQIRQQYWPQRDNRNFSANYRRVVQRYLVHQNQREFCCFVFFAPLDLNSPLLSSFNKPTLGTTAVQVKLKA